MLAATAAVLEDFLPLEVEHAELTPRVSVRATYRDPVCVAAAPEQPVLEDHEGAADEVGEGVADGVAGEADVADLVRVRRRAGLLIQRLSVDEDLQTRRI